MSHVTLLTPVTCLYEWRCLFILASFFAVHKTLTGIQLPDLIEIPIMFFAHI